MSDQIKRNIYYYELFALAHNEEVNTVYKDKNNSYINAFFEQLANQQAEQDDYSDYIVKTNQGEVIIIIDKVIEKNYYFRIALCRENALPFIEKNGKLESLGNYIDNDQNIAEITHCIYYGQYGVLGSEYNYNGARCPVLVDYILRRDEAAPIIQCHPKFNYDTYKKIIKDKDFTLFEIAIKTNSSAYTDVLASKHIFNAMQAAVPDSDSFEVIIKKRKTKKNGNKGFDNPLTEEEIIKLITDYRDDLLKFKLSQTSFCECIDLLSDKFVGKTILVKTEERSIDSVAMYDAINQYFRQNVEPYCEIIKKGA